jgi:hypothetical protein
LLFPKLTHTVCLEGATILLNRTMDPHKANCEISSSWNGVNLGGQAARRLDNDELNGFPQENEQVDSNQPPLEVFYWNSTTTFLLQRPLAHWIEYSHRALRSMNFQSPNTPTGIQDGPLHRVTLEFPARQAPHWFRGWIRPGTGWVAGLDLSDCIRDVMKRPTGAHVPLVVPSVRNLAARRLRSPFHAMVH